MSFAGSGSDPKALRTRGFAVNRRLSWVVVSVDGLALFAAPMLLGASSPIAQAAAFSILFAASVLAGLRWSLVHEAIHGRLLPTPRANEVVGRILCVGHGASLGLLRIGHQLHHRYNRTPIDRAEVMACAGPHAPIASLWYYGRLVGGLYLAELAATLAAWLPQRVRSRAATQFGEETMAARIMAALSHRSTLAEVRLDAAAVSALYAVAFWAYGGSAWLLAVLLGVRAAAISISDNCYHYGTPLDEPRNAIDARAPRWVSALLLDFNLHGVHHRFPQLAWFELRRRFEAETDGHEPALLQCMLRQLRGPLAAGRGPWHPAADAESSRPAL